VVEAEESNFYNQYSWCLNAFPQVREVVGHLREELKKLDVADDDWRKLEVITNCFLLSCSITDTLDDYLAGSTYDLSKVSRVLPFAKPLVTASEYLLNIPGKFRAMGLLSLKRWRTVWASAVTDFLQFAVVSTSPDPVAILRERDRLIRLLPKGFPKSFGDRLPKIPAFFRSRDFATFDCLELGRTFVRGCSERERPIVVVGLRTAGSFLAPLLCAFLRSEGFTDVEWLAVRPKKGLTPWERATLEQGSKKRTRALIIDESIHSGSTLIEAVDSLRGVGFREEDLVVMNPVEPALPDWKNSPALQSLPHVHVVTLEPADRWKQRLLDSQTAQQRIADYFRVRGYVNVQFAISSETERWNHPWRTEPPEKVDVRLKRVYEVHLEDRMGAREIRCVLAKSVGFGWLGYHAFLIASRLKQFVPSMLGLRDGILYIEWFPQPQCAAETDRPSLIETVGSYIAARSQLLRLPGNPTPALGREGRHNGYQMLSYSLSRAYNSPLARGLKQSRIQAELARQSSAEAVLTDSKLSAEEWIEADGRLLKTDFEHHCQGKNELLMTDPAFDLASAIFFLNLNEMEASRVIDLYTEKTGDREIERRLYFNKLAVALWHQNRAASALRHSRLLHRRDEFNRQFTAAWNFLVGQSVRECAKLCKTPDQVQWHGPLVVTDIDGVMDRMVFGFPLTTAAGIQAISLLHAHGYAIALNTARTLDEVKLYCRAFGFAGGVAEYGGVIWDAVRGREQVLVSSESLHELDRVRDALRHIPGVFLNEDYKNSLRAYTLKGDKTIPIPSMIVQDTITSLGIKSLRIVHTGLDTAVLAKDLDKGTGLLAMQDFVGFGGTKVFSIGDSEPDLAMFRVSTGSFAPGNVTCRREARALGTWIAAREYQPGLLEAVRRIVHTDGEPCDRCRAVADAWPRRRSLFTELLEAADQKPLSSSIGALWGRSAFDIFKK
jgi:hydroxymethylpyrimidine pyrophosphatase-like HAD family hydrolase